MLGFINLNKPAGFTSHDCVARVRRLLHIKKVGHGGTLDPAATGVLPIAVGKATRLLQFLPDNKAYLACIRLGMRTTTDDLEGEIIETKPGVNLSLPQIEKCLSHFVGEIEQIPPIYSAIKRKGKNLYELARKGEIIDIPPRMVTIEKIEIVNFFPGEFTELELKILCGPGTYIRSIARDLGTVLGVGGTLANLIRTESCGMKLADSLTLEELAIQIERGTFQLIEPERALQNLDTFFLNSTESRSWCQGQCIYLNLEKYSDKKIIENTEYPIKVQQKNGDFLGIGICSFEGDKLEIMPKIVCAN
ncbi:tRNA pseudouridine(55) synthase TruB [Pleurocapsales cyanobacterium LEGE 06147]|nr:tRNA pseudouridine(55) synthase TruB [Pleurocapsales cyanobacterium LEGE 06147]